MRTPQILIFTLWLLIPAFSRAEITPSDVYAQVVQIEKEIIILKKHFAITQEKPAPPITAELKPRHVWQKSYFILAKINLFRHKHHLPVLTLNTLEPVLKLDPALVYEQTQRILTEIRILKTRLHITQFISPVEKFSGKQPIDVFNKLNWISYQWDELNGKNIDPSYVFAEVMRIYEDINSILSAKYIEDTSFPPEKQPTMQAVDSLQTAFVLMAEVQRLQRNMGIPRTDFSVFRKHEQVLKSDVFNIVGMVLAELQTIKAGMDLSHALTPPAASYQGKASADVHQLLGWAVHKIQLIKTL